MGLQTETPQFYELVRIFAHSVGKVRGEQRALVLEATCSQADFDRLALELAQQPNENVRIAAAEVLGIKRAVDNLPALVDALQNDASPAVRASAAESLGLLGSSDGLAPLVRALTTRGVEKVRYAAATALADLPDGGAALGDALAELKNGALKSRAIQLAGTTHDQAAIPAVRAALTADDDRVARAAAEALRELAGAAAIDPLGQVLTDATRTPKVRARAAAELGKLGDADAIPSLTAALLGDEDATVRGAAALALENLGDGASKVREMVSWLKGNPVERGGIDANEVVRALRAPDAGSGPSGSLSASLIEAAIGQDARVTSLLAALVVSSCDGSVTSAGQAINELALTHQWSASQVEALRIEVGGQTALDPLLRALQADLHTYFQMPIHELNEATRRDWERTMKSAQQGFRARLYMSIAVFVVGIALVVVSSIRFLIGDVSGDAVWGTGVPFVSGLGTMLLVVYTGPLKEIRQSVSDLGAASAAFIAYVHQILEVSHTFTSLYMHEQMTFEEAQKSNRLITDALASTVTYLNPNSADPVNGAKTERPVKQATGIESGGDGMQRQALTPD